MMRMTADQFTHDPTFFYINNNRIKILHYPTRKNVNVFDISHIEKEKERDNRIETFVNRINSDYEIDLSFEKNLENFISKNKIRKGVQNKIWEVVSDT